MEDELEIRLQSGQLGSDFEVEVSLTITAYLQEDKHIDKNTLAFRCDPGGSTYERCYLRVTFDSWSRVREIRDFIHRHFSNSELNRRTLRVPVEDGVYSFSPADSPPNETEGLDDITVQIEGDRIDFNRAGPMMLPYIHTYQLQAEGEQDSENLDRLLNFFDETIAVHPDFDPGHGNAIEDSDVLNPVRVKQNISEIVDTEAELYQDYEKAVREYEAGEYGDCIRDLGRAVEIMVNVVTLQDRTEDEVPGNVAGRLNLLDKSEDGLPSFIAKTLSPVWWLRNKVSHPNSYEPTQEEAEYALHSFQVATEVYIREYVGIEDSGD